MLSYATGDKYVGEFKENLFHGAARALSLLKARDTTCAMTCAPDDATRSGFGVYTWAEFRDANLEIVRGRCACSFPRALRRVRVIMARRLPVQAVRGSL